MKVVINRCFGGFGLSHAAVMRYAELSGFALYPWLDKITKDIYKARAVIGGKGILHHYSRVPVDGLPFSGGGFGGPDLPDGAYFSPSDISRTDQILIRVVEEMGTASYGDHAKLAVIEIPDGTNYTIEDYGSEHIAEVHETWR